MRAECRSCQRCGRVDPGRWVGRPGPLWCFFCGRQITVVDVSDWSAWIAEQIERKRALQAAGELHTRKQSARESDTEIGADGLAGELAACLLLCPGFLSEWQRSVELSVSNRGRDLLPSWTGGRRSVEVKYTKHRDETRGYLLLRPPPWKGPTCAPSSSTTAFMCWCNLIGRPMVLAAGWTGSGFLPGRSRTPGVSQLGKSIAGWFTGLAWIRSTLYLSRLRSTLPCFLVSPRQMGTVDSTFGMGTLLTMAGWSSIGKISGTIRAVFRDIFTCSAVETIPRSASRSTSGPRLTTRTPQTISVRFRELSEDIGAGSCRLFRLTPRGAG